MRYLLVFVDLMISLRFAHPKAFDIARARQVYLQKWLSKEEISVTGDVRVSDKGDEDERIS
jgi:hypothetical protein